MIKRIAAISDVHGCYEELEILYNKLCWISLDEIWCLGDLVDRGPHSGKTIEFCRKNNIKGVMGNHDSSIINHWDNYIKSENLPKNPDKLKTIKEITQEDVNYLKSLPYLHVIDDLNTVLVHAGLWPKLPLYAQPTNVCRLQMVHPNHPRKTRWFGPDAPIGPSKKTEEQSLKEGWNRWYKVYDHQQNCYFGHSTFYQPMIWQNEGYGKCVGIDTGSSFGGCLTAAIIDDTETPTFMSVKNKELYYKSAHRIFSEG